MSHIVINGQKIEWSFIQWLRKRWFGGDWHRTIDCFYKARNADGDNGVIRYIRAGLKPDANGNRYSLMASHLLENGEAGKKTLMTWWQQYYKTKRQADPDSVGDIFKKIAQGTLE